ncbi:MAG: hypothetical protein U1F77_19900 [Kiritimatiellia bacterium]
MGAASTAFTAQYIYHNPRTTEAPASTLQLNPAPENGAGAPVDVWMKVGTLAPADIDSVCLYYTTDNSFPEGMGGIGIGSTRTIPLAWQSNESPNNAWWKGVLPAMPAGTRVRYKAGVFNRNINIASVFPSGAANVELKKSMMTVFKIDGFNMNGPVPPAQRLRRHGDGTPGGIAFPAGPGVHQQRRREPLPRRFHLQHVRPDVLLRRPNPGREIRFPQENDTVGRGRSTRWWCAPTETVTFSISRTPSPPTTISPPASPSATASPSNGVGQAWVAATEVTRGGAISSAFPKSTASSCATFRRATRLWRSRSGCSS